MDTATKVKQMQKPKTIVMCGSSRFIQIMAVAEWFLARDELAITMGLNLLPPWYPDCPPDHLAEHEGCAKEMDELHLRKIDLADEIFVVDWDDYIGGSTAKEIEYALKNDKYVRYFSDDHIGRLVCEAIIKGAGMFQKPPEPEKPTLASIAMEISAKYNTPIKKLRSRSRKQEYVRVRNIAMRAMRAKTDATLEEIGLFFNRGHAAVLHALKQG